MFAALSPQRGLRSRLGPAPASRRLRNWEAGQRVGVQVGSNRVDDARQARGQKPRRSRSRTTSWTRLAKGEIDAAAVTPARNWLVQQKPIPMDASAAFRPSKTSRT